MRFRFQLAVIAALLFVLLIAEGTFAQPTWGRCASDDVLEISHLDLSPETPAPGDKLIVSLRGRLDRAVTSGKIVIRLNLPVLFFSIPVYTHTLDLCDTIRGAGAECPLSRGDISLNVSQVLPANIPRSKYTGQVEVQDQDAKILTCVKLDFNFERAALPAPAESPAATATPAATIGEPISTVGPDRDEEAAVVASADAQQAGTSSTTEDAAEEEEADEEEAAVMAFDSELEGMNEEEMEQVNEHFSQSYEKEDAMMEQLAGESEENEEESAEENEGENEDEDAQVFMLEDLEDAFDENSMEDYSDW